MSTLYLRGKSVWIGFTDPATGLRKLKATGFKLDKVERKNDTIVFPKHVKEFQRQFDSALVLGKWGMMERPVKQIALSEALDLFLSTKGSLLKRSTVRNYRLAVRKLTQLLGDKRLAEYTEETLFNFRNALLESENKYTVAMYLRHLSALFRWASEKGFTPKSPITRDVKMNPPPPLPVIFTPDELDAVFDIIYGRREAAVKPDPPLADQLFFLLLTGFRSGESCELTWERVDLKRKIIKHWNEKAGRWEVYPIDDLLDEHLSRQPLIYAQYVFKYRHPATLHHRLKAVVRHLGLNDKLSVHSLKKTYVDALTESETSEGDAHILAHHKSFQTTLGHYVYRNADRLRKILARSRSHLRLIGNKRTAAS